MYKLFVLRWPLQWARHCWLQWHISSPFITRCYNCFNYHVCWWWWTSHVIARKRLWWHRAKVFRDGPLTNFSLSNATQRFVFLLSVIMDWTLRSTKCQITLTHTHTDTHTLLCVVAHWAPGLLEASARDGWGYEPPVAANNIKNKRVVFLI